MSVITRKKDKLEYLTAEGITAAHCFTTRHGGISTGSQASMNLAVGRGDSEENVEANLRTLAFYMGFDAEKYVLTRQTHSDIVRVVTEDDCRGFFHRDYAIGLVTNTPGITLMVFTADCTPLLFHDPVTGAVGAAHAGWRGTARNIGGKTVEAMIRHFGSKPEDIRAAIGPNLGQCHFETDLDVPAAITANYGDEVLPFIRQKGKKYFPDLKAINAMALRRAGVRHIEISDACTWCESDRFWSHRVTKGDRGSQGAVITCKEGKA